MKNGLARTNWLIAIGGLFLVAFLALWAVSPKPALATTANNQTINFQGRLLNSQGAVVPDGYYNIEFKIYQDGDGQSAGDTSGSPAGSLKWTEDYLVSNSQGARVANGFLSVQLGSINPFGSSINWNAGNLWLSMNVGGTGASPSWDGEMLPMQPLTASPYALNSGELNGLTSSNFLQLAQGVQTDASTVSSIFVNKTGTSGNILELQKGGSDVVSIGNSGQTVFKAASGSDSASFFQVQSSGSATPVFDVDTTDSFVGIGTASPVAQLTVGTTGDGTTAPDVSNGDLVDVGGYLKSSTNNQEAFKTHVTVAPSADSNQTYSGGTFNLSSNSSHVAAATFQGTNSAVSFSGSGTLGTAEGAYYRVQNTSSGTISSAYGIQIASPSNSGTLTNTYGLYIASQTVGTQTNTPYGIYQAGSSDLNLFDGATTITNSSAAAFQVQNSSGYGVVTADASAYSGQGQVVLGSSGHNNGTLTFANSAGSGTATITLAGNPTTNYTYQLPTSTVNSGQCLQSGTVSGGTVPLTFGACGASGTFLAKNATDSSSAAAGSGYLYGFTSTGSSTGGVLSLNNSTNTGSTLYATTAGNPASGKAVIYGQNTNASPSGNLLDLQSGSSPTSKFSVDAAGNVSLGGSSPVKLQGTATNGTLDVYANGTGTLALDTTGAGTVDLGGANAASVNIGNNNSTAITIGGSTSTGTVTVQASGISQTITGSATAPTYVIKSNTNYSGAFQVQNSNSQSVFGVDTSNKQAVLGQANAVNGALVFQNSSSGNGVTINSTAANSNYTLTLPTVAPAGGLCIETTPGNASQLTFASCSNNNASIQKVNEWDSNNASTLPVSPSTAGDEMVLTTQIPTSGVTVSSISGGGVTNWTKVVTSAGNGTVSRVEMWVGTVTTTGSATISVTYCNSVPTCPSSPGSNEITTTEFTAAGVNANTSWGIESSSSQLNNIASTTFNFPNMTAVNGSELYIGYAQVQQPPATGNATPNFSYIQTSTQHNIIAYDPSLTANTPYQPSALQNSAGESNTVSAILTAFVTSSSINNTTSLQKANFYVQAATSGSVAGVLQAASSGSADILDLRDSGGNNILAVGASGTVLLKPPASTSAFQVQNSSGWGILTVDTQNSQAVLGTAGHQTGVLTFNDASDSNTISITAPSSVATSYNLALPNNAPTAGLCLATSPSDANQLIFSSCATQVSAATISYVNEWDSHGSGVTSLPTVSPTSVGDLMVFYSHTGSGGTINTISGGGVPSGGWTKVTAYTGAGTPGNIEMWRGVVTTAGASAISVTYNGTAGTNEIVAEEFTMGSANGTWAIDTSGTATSTSSVATVNYPTLTPLNSNELYAGYAFGGGTMSLSSPTAGFTYVPTSYPKYLTYKTNVVGGTPYTPVVQQSSSVYASIAAVIEAYVGTSVIVNTTSTQEANFNVQASVSGTVAGILQAASSGTADIFQAKDSTGNNVMAINTSNINGVDGVTLGTSNAVGGQLTFNSGGNSNSVTIEAPTTPGTSYNLKLPSASPAPGQCLASSPSDVTQLVFSSCANQVTSVAISLADNWEVSTSGLTPSLSITPVNLGDLITFFIYASKGNTINSVGGTCGITWSKLVGINSEEMWRGIVTSTSTCNITASLSTPSGPTDEMAAQEWTTGSTNGSWVIDASGTISNSGSSTVNYPSLTPQSTKDLYIGYAIGTSTMSGGFTSGYTYFSGAGADMYGTYNTAISAATQPTASQSGGGTSMAAAALIAAYSSSSVIANSTNTQQANFNIQAATSGSVAGTLQAFYTGTGDILDMLDGSGNLVGSVGYTGNMLVKPSTASAAAFQVQTPTGNVNVFSVDTSSSTVVVGAGTSGDPSSSLSLLVLDSETGTTADPTVVNGAMYYNATNGTFRCGVSGAWQNCSGLLYSNTSKSSVNSSCSNNCAAFSTAASVPVGYCVAGRVIKLSAEGVFSSQAAATNLQFGVYYGSDPSVASNDVLLGTLSPAESVTSASNNYFDMEFNATCFSTTSMQSGGVLNLQVGAAASGLTPLPINAYSPATVVNSGPGPYYLYIFPVWSAASASDTAQITQFNVTGP